MAPELTAHAREPELFLFGQRPTAPEGYAPACLTPENACMYVCTDMCMRGSRYEVPARAMRRRASLAASH